MGFKKIERNLGFADFALASSMEKNRSLSTPVKFVRRMFAQIPWITHHSMKCLRWS